MRIGRPGEPRVLVSVVLSFAIPQRLAGESAAEILKAIDPPSLPHFAGDARVVIPPHSNQLEAWLDDRLEVLP